jgi:hypothetical protein
MTIYYAATINALYLPCLYYSSSYALRYFKSIEDGVREESESHEAHHTLLPIIRFEFYHVNFSELQC